MGVVSVVVVVSVVTDSFDRIGGRGVSVVSVVGVVTDSFDCIVVRIRWAGRRARRL